MAKTFDRHKYKYFLKDTRCPKCRSRLRIPKIIKSSCKGVPSFGKEYKHHLVRRLSYSLINKRCSYWTSKSAN